MKYKDLENEWSKGYEKFIKDNKSDKDKRRIICHKISKNPNITWDIIRENLDKPWDWKAISLNKFQKEKQLFIEKSFTKYLSVYKIQQWWLHITMSPYYKIGRKFIDRSTNELMDEYNGMI